MKQFRVYKSSAGSGKTTTLVNEYLRLCLPNPEKFKNIIALTFTIKATNEMKQRLIETLHNIINSSTEKEDKKLSFIFSYLISNTGLTKKEIIENSQKLLHLILHNYSQFSFSTLDSFIVNIVRSFAFELKLPAAFDIELNQQILIDQSLEMLFAEIGKNKIITDYLVNYVINQVDEESSFKIENSLSELAQLLFESSNSRYIQQLDNLTLKDFSKTSDFFKTKTKEYELFIQKSGENCLKNIESKGLNGSDFLNGERGVYGFFKKINNKDLRNLFGTRVMEALEENKWYKTGLAESKKQAIDSLIPLLSETITEVKKIIPEYTSFKLLNENIIPLALLGELRKNINKISLEEGLVHLSEMNTRISDIVSQEPIPYIYERTGKKFHHFLVDEFQDTSKIQWNNLIPLIENGLSSGYYNMVVGDAKDRKSVV